MGSRGDSAGQGLDIHVPGIVKRHSVGEKRLPNLPDGHSRAHRSLLTVGVDRQEPLK